MIRNRFSLFLMIAALVCASAPAARGEAPATRPATASTKAPEAATAPSASQPTTAAGPLLVEYIYRTGCAHCEEAKKTVDAVAKKYGDRIRLVRYNQAEDEGALAAAACDERHGRTKVEEASTAPSVYVGPLYLGGEDEIARRLDASVAEELARLGRPGTVAVSTQPARSGREIVEHRFSSFTVGAIVVAGLIDGVNPCAFTTIIFLLSMLALLKRSRTEMAIVSAGFTFSVFLTYLLLGAGLFVVIREMAFSRGVSMGITYAMAAFTFFLGAWSFFDAIRIALTGKTPKIALGMPNRIKQAVHKVIRDGLKTRGLLVGSLVVGFLVSILESICTGQVYLPTITLMVRSTDHWVGAMGYLVLYNLMFILPLVVLTVLAYFGIGSERLGKFMGRRVGLAKVALGILFTGLGVLLLVTA